VLLSHPVRLTAAFNLHNLELLEKLVSLLAQLLDRFMQLLLLVLLLFENAFLIDLESTFSALELSALLLEKLLFLA